MALALTRTPSTAGRDMRSVVTNIYLTKRVSVTNIFHIKGGTNIISIPVLFLWPPYSFSIQNAEAALLHGADVKDMIEEPMKVGRGIFLAETSGQNICKKINDIDFVF